MASNAVFEAGNPASPDSIANHQARLVDYGLILFLAATLFALRFGGPSNLTDNDQERPASYVLDALRNGHWILQYDWLGDVTSKPPAYTWLAAMASLPLGRVTLFTLYLPCFLAILGAAALLYAEGTRALGRRAGLLAAVFLLANPLSAKLVALARTDAVFLFGVSLTAVLAFRAWMRGGGWITAWLAAAFATLTKGPLGIALGFAGLTSWIWERRRGAPSPASLAQALGFVLLVVICGGWFFLAWRFAGDALIQKMLKAELVDHVVAEGSAARMAKGLVIAPAYFLSRFAPWSLLAVVGVWRALKRPEGSPGARRLQCFATLWLLVGLAVFGLASHQRGDLIAPLMPPGAILAAIPARDWLRAASTRSFLAITIATALALAVGFQIEHLTRRRAIFAETRALEVLARDFLGRGGDPDKLVPVDTPYALQFFMNTMRLAVSPDEAAVRLSTGQDSFASVTDVAAIEESLQRRGHKLRLVAGDWTPATNGTKKVAIIAVERPAP